MIKPYSLMNPKEATFGDIVYYLLFSNHELDTLGTINEIDCLLFRKMRLVAMSPPDVFCIAAALLKHSNAYTQSRALLTNSSLQTELRERAREWIQDIGKEAPNHYVMKGLLHFCFNERTSSSWKFGAQLKVIDSESLVRDQAIDSAKHQHKLREQILELLIVSDIAAADFANRSESQCLRLDSEDLYALVKFRWDAELRVTPGVRGSTLCRYVNPSKARVLPKRHTPGRGLSLRSLSNNLAYIDADQGSPHWFTIPKLDASRSVFNVLLVPYPYEVRNQCFSVDERLGPKHAYFSYLPEDSSGECVGKIERLCEQAKEQSGQKIDFVVLPELALNVKDYRILRESLLARGIILICGVGGRTQEGREENRICIDIPVGDEHGVHLRQKKHHFWQLDKEQIEQYRLSSVFDPGQKYWERLNVGDRHLCFVRFHPKLLTGVLICEDLCQYEPVGKLVRAVGPDLVIALLMDAPQIAGRWPDRYASVLKDDPGCSVLTLTCLGISERTKDLKRYQTDKSRFVAFWNDPIGGPKELELAKEAGGLLLNLALDSRDEWTIDLRHREAETLRLVDYHQVLLTPEDPQKNLGLRESRGVSFPAHRSTLSPVEISTLSRLAWLSSLVDELAGEIERRKDEGTSTPDSERNLRDRGQGSLDAGDANDQLTKNFHALSDFFLQALSVSRRSLEKSGKAISDCLIELTRGAWEQTNMEDDLEFWKSQRGDYSMAVQDALRILRDDLEGWSAAIRARKRFIGLLKGWARLDL